MTLSDACSDFLRSVMEAIDQLAEDVHFHSAPSSPIPYGPEIDALRRACLAASEAPYDPEAATRVIRLALSTIRFHDTPPGAEQEKERKAEMTRLIQALQKDLDPDDAAAVPAVVEQIVTETPYSAKTAQRLKLMLSKLGKPAYDVAIKIIGDVASATVKKTLGL